MAEVIPLKKEPLALINHRNNFADSASVYLVFNRKLTKEEYRFFIETTQRTVFLMRGIAEKESE